MEKKIIKAVIFDMDGVISDTEIIQSEATSLILAEKGIIIAPQEISARYAGISAKITLKEIFRGHKKENIDIDKLVEEKLKRTYVLAENNVKAIEGTVEFINKLIENGLSLAVGSGSNPGFVDFVLTELNLKNKFAAIVSTYETKNGKPAPDVFLLAAQRLNVLPEDCLVIEDGVSGMLAAKAAGMECVGLVRGTSDQKYPADLLVKNLGDKKIWEIYEFGN
jgi:HAD superfamily hydrolase (TIGR01509 family)